MQALPRFESISLRERNAAPSLVSLFLALSLAGCGSSSGGSSLFTPGGSGVDDPLAVPAGEARAGRIDASELPADASEYLTWEGGDFVLANERVAMVIEDVGPSELYDPWGGKPVGLSRMEGGAMVDPADFGELFFFVGRTTLMAEHVGVVADGRDGRAAIVRAQGLLRPLPFIDDLIGGLFKESFEGVYAAFDYVLEPGADYVDLYMSFRSEREEELGVGFAAVHGFMYTPRMPVWVTSGKGFGAPGTDTDFVAFVDESGASYTYSVPGERLAGLLSASGFVSNSGPKFTVPPGESNRLHARITIGGRGLDGALVAHARMAGAALRTITGRVVDSSGAPVPGASVHAMSTDADPAHRNRVHSGDDGRFSLHVPEGEDVDLYLFRRGDRAGGPYRVTADQADAGDVALPAGGFVLVKAATELGGGAIPARIQIRLGPDNADPLPVPDPKFGEDEVADGRVQQIYALPGQDEVLRLPTGQWEVIVSRGYEYEIETALVDVVDQNCDPEVDASACPTVTPVLERSVDTTGVMCGDLHIHTRRSNDVGDDPRVKLVSAAADGVEVPARSDHEYIEDWDDDVFALGLAPYLYGLTSLELTTFQQYGHFGVVPLDPDPDAPNGGAIPWQTYPTPETPDVAVQTDPPPTVFERVLARPEQPALIVNHPSGGTNYFGYVGLDAATGTVAHEDRWSTLFHAIEVFNSSDWVACRDEQVAQWLSLLNHGLRRAATGASDTHGISHSPVGYPRTCFSLGVDEPPMEPADRRALADDVRDSIIAGSTTVSGGIYVTTKVGEVGPGGDATGLGDTAQVEITVQAPSWVDVDAIEIVVDGETLETIAAADFVPGIGAVRHQATHAVPVSANGSYVIVAAYGDEPLLIHPGYIPFGVANPIYLSR
jgi:hypothetical protein